MDQRYNPEKRRFLAQTIGGDASSEGIDGVLNNDQIKSFTGYVRQRNRALSASEVYELIFRRSNPEILSRSVSTGIVIKLDTPELKVAAVYVPAGLSDQGEMIDNAIKHFTETKKAAFGYSKLTKEQNMQGWMETKVIPAVLEVLTINLGDSPELRMKKDDGFSDIEIVAELNKKGIKTLRNNAVSVTHVKDAIGLINSETPDKIIFQLGIYNKKFYKLNT